MIGHRVSRAPHRRRRRPRGGHAGGRGRRHAEIAGWAAAPVLGDPVAVAAGIGVGISSSVIPYVCDQLAMARLARQTYALLVSLLPATATVIGLLVLAQLPTPVELAGLALVVAGVAGRRAGRQPLGVTGRRTQDDEIAGRVVEQPGDVVGGEASCAPSAARRRRSGRSARARSARAARGARCGRARSGRRPGRRAAAARCSIASSSGQRERRTARGSAASSGRASGTARGRRGPAWRPRRGRAAARRRARARDSARADEREAGSARAAGSARRGAAPARDERAGAGGADARAPRASSDDDRQASSVALLSRLARSATIRTSTPGSARSRRDRQRLAQARAAPPRGARRAHQDVGRAALARHARGGLGDVVALLDDQVRAEHATPAAAARRAARAPPRSARGPGADPQDVELGAEPLGRAPRAADDALRAAAAGVTSASSRSPTACGAASPRRRSSRGRRRLAHEPLGLDLLGDLAQRDLAQRREVLDPEEAVQRGGDALGRVDLARAQALDQRLAA